MRFYVEEVWRRIAGDREPSLLRAQMEAFDGSPGCEVIKWFAGLFPILPLRLRLMAMDVVMLFGEAGYYTIGLG